MTALRIIVEVPDGEKYQAAVAVRISNASRPEIKYVRPGDRVELFIEDGAHVDVGKARMPEEPCR